jgi:hypothetical protein
MTEEELAREEELAESIKYHAARFVWVNKNQRTPRRIPWPVWFEKKFGEPFNEFVQRKSQEKRECQPEPPQAELL